MVILGIETSCDDTAVSVVEAEKGIIKVLSNAVSSQIKLHSQWGGVVPNLAAREHLKNIIPVIKAGLAKAKIKPEDIDLIAVTQGPGLIPALMVGNSVAKTLAYIWQKPLLGIHHIEGHIYANFVHPHPTLYHRERGSGGEGKIKFPILCLVVSGGHTQLVLMKKHLDYKIIGETLDDAAGEAFDKVARILNLGYPGGPAIAQRAMEFPISPVKASGPRGFTGNFQFPIKSKLQITNYKLRLPRPMLNSKNLNFSFSGLKTAVLYLVKKNPKILKNKKIISLVCSEFQQAVVDVLIAKTLKAAEKYRPRTIMLAGGVSANQELRKQLKQAIKQDFPNTSYIIPDTLYSIDNAVMIAAAAHFRWGKMNKTKRKKAEKNWSILEPSANLKLV
ncbi:MAG: tRNA (adenosine(37)-N6)-threonylcarbamoyltransferase complex transferase subunit TsaD [Candidatus Moranbacteria bacterium]|nr:tRNA (adenosine(37)-N6)-threonylcarbamoyltransferase complex transferase subunit TsaD [Candidatus Moranbacteria bacterium]